MDSIGRIVQDIAPSPGNPRNSEGAFYTLDDGRILYIYSKFIGDSGNDDGDACIACRISEDDGQNWSQDRILFRAEDHSAINIMSVSCLIMEDGAIGLFYGVRYGWHDTRLHLRRSYDQGQTWSDAVVCIPAKGYYVTNNDRVIRLRSGRILVPANFHRMAGTDIRDWKSIDLRGIPSMFYSDDDGYTWHQSKGDCFTTLPHSKSGLQESGVIELKTGVVWQWMRTDVGCQYESFSVDEGDTWTPPMPSVFTSPCSPLSMKRMPDGKKLLAIYNPIPNYNGRGRVSTYRGRTPLALTVSSDEGRTWSEPINLEDDSDTNYCYPCIHFVGEWILAAYMVCTDRGVGTVIRRIPAAQLP